MKANEGKDNEGRRKRRKWDSEDQKRPRQCVCSKCLPWPKEIWTESTLVERCSFGGLQQSVRICVVHTEKSGCKCLLLGKEIAVSRDVWMQLWKYSWLWQNKLMFRYCREHVTISLMNEISQSNTVNKMDSLCSEWQFSLSKKIQSSSVRLYNPMSGILRHASSLRVLQCSTKSWCIFLNPLTIVGSKGCNTTFAPTTVGSKGCNTS